MTPRCRLDARRDGELYVVFILQLKKDCAQGRPLCPGMPSVPRDALCAQASRAPKQSGAGSGRMGRPSRE